MLSPLARAAARRSCALAMRATAALPAARAAAVDVAALAALSAADAV
jgi:hypothetical protein